MLATAFTFDPTERYLLAVTLAGASDDPTVVEYEAWDRIRALALLDGRPPLPALLPPALPLLLRCALLGADGLLVGWEPDSLEEAVTVAARECPEAARVLLACLRGSGREVDAKLDALASFGGGSELTVTETERSCTRWLLPDSAASVDAAGPPLG